MNNSPKAILVGGTFNEAGGKPSKLIETLYNSMATNGVVDVLPNFTLLNGGSFNHLQAYLKHSIPHMDYVFWFANVYNTMPKLVQEIKKINSRCILVTSKRNFEKQYELNDLIQHALNLKSNLIVEFSGTTGNIEARVLDPLGNLILDYTNDFVKLGKALSERVKYLKSITRVGSISVGDAIEVPDEPEFFEFVRKSAEQFSKLLPTPSENHRFLGNASFRCQRGFPSFRSDNGKIFVSKRNVDKEFIGRDGFVAVEPNILPVEYYGDHKPSVDTPIQIKLYDACPKINFMIHGHVYLNEVNQTSNNVPCGGLEEVNEILKALAGGYPIYRCNNEVIGVNLKGHGFIAGYSQHYQFNDVMKKMDYMFRARKLPEKI